MNDLKPLYLVKTSNNKDMHIVVGTDIETLCGKHNVISAIQTNKKRITDGHGYSEDVEFCSECKDKWDKIKSDVNIEPIIDCLHCDRAYSAIKARNVSEYGNDGQSCKRCYQKLKNDPSSNVDVPYEEATAPFDGFQD